MKKISISLLLIAIISLSVIGVIFSQNQPQTEYLRIHIRANSNQEIDQAVKLKIKEEIVQLLTPRVAECQTKDMAAAMIKESLSDIEKVSDGVLKGNGFLYKSRAKLNTELFPTRTYGSLTLEEGYYDALIVELGDGKGDNWWCVVYPPLCFTGEGTSYVYRSKIADIINKFFRDKEEQ